MTSTYSITAIFPFNWKIFITELLLVITLISIGGLTAYAQTTTVPKTFFGYSTSNCKQCTNPGSQGFDPGSSAGSNPPVTGLISEGKMYPGNEMDIFQPPRSSYLETITNFSGFTGSNTTFNYAIFHTTYSNHDLSLWEWPPWMKCFNYTNGTNGGMGSYPGPPTWANSQPCSDPVDPGGYADGNCRNTDAKGNGWCPGPSQLQLATSTLSNVGGIPVHNGIPWEVMNVECNAMVYAEEQGHPFQFFEIIVEPDVVGQWEVVPSSNSDLIIQSYYVKQAILHGFGPVTVNGVTMPGCSGLTNPADDPIFIGPSISTRSTSYVVNAINNFFSSDSCVDNLPTLTTGTVNVCGTDVVSPNGGGFHLYLGGIDTTTVSIPVGCTLNAVGCTTVVTCPQPAINVGTCPPTCGTPVSTPTIYATIGCTGQGLISAVQGRLAAFFAAGITGVLQTEGSWAQNNYIPQYNDPDVTAQLDTEAWVMRYEFIQALEGEEESVWFSWAGNSLPTQQAAPNYYGTLCDTNPGGVLTPPPCLVRAGIAFSTLANWIGGSTVTKACAITGGCLDQEGSLWGFNLTEANGVDAEIVWVYSVLSPHKSVFVTVPSGFSQYRNYLNQTTLVHAGQEILATVVPILVEKVTQTNQTQHTHCVSKCGGSIHQ